jgi:hypothetical protein
MIYHPFDLYFSNSEGSKKLPDDGRLLPKHVGARIWNKERYKSVHSVGHFYYTHTSLHAIFTNNVLVTLEAAVKGLTD